MVSRRREEYRLLDRVMHHDPDAGFVRSALPGAFADALRRGGEPVPDGWRVQP